MMMMQMRRCFSVQMKKPKVCYYKILNVSAAAEMDDIKKSYYELAKKYHPDSSNSEVDSAHEVSNHNHTYSQEKFKSITEAYSILSDTEKRDRYDRLIFGDKAGAKATFDN